MRRKVMTYIINMIMMKIITLNLLMLIRLVKDNGDNEDAVCLMK